MTEENNVNEPSAQELQQRIQRYDSLVQRLQTVVGQATSQREEYALLLTESQGALQKALERVKELEEKLPEVEMLPAPEVISPGSPPES